MDRQWWETAAPLLVGGLGAALFAAALGHHLGEVRRVEGVAGPLLALLLDGAPAVVLAYGGYRLARTGLSPAQRRAVCGWSFGGAALFVSVVGASMAIRAREGRVVSEPLFTLLLVAETGALAGLVAGYYAARARADALRFERATDALAFVNGVTRHDLRNDLNVIDGHATLAAERTGDEAVSEHVAVVERKTDEALDRLADVGAITETLVEGGDLRSVDLAAVARETADRIESTTGATVTTDLPERAPVVADDGLGPVVDNLVENAVEHGASSEPTVDVSVDRGEDGVQLTVRDDGPGIPEEQRTALLDVDEGLRDSGLQVVGTLVDRYDGDVTVDGGDSGTTFVVELPRATVGRRATDDRQTPGES
jgi:signal transduction histidine kinase